MSALESSLSEASCFGSCFGFYVSYFSPDYSFNTAHTTVQSGNLSSTHYNTEVYSGSTQNKATIIGSFWDDGTWHPIDGPTSFSFGSGFFLAPTTPDRGMVMPVAGPVEFVAFGAPGLLRSAAGALARGVAADGGEALEPTLISTNPRNLIPTQTRAEMSGSQVKRLAKDMEQNGFDESQPVDAWRNPIGRLEIQDGHHRTAAAIEAGLEKIPVLVWP